MGGARNVKLGTYGRSKDQGTGGNIFFFVLDKCGRYSVVVFIKKMEWHLGAEPLIRGSKG